MADITRKEYFDIVEGAAERFAKAYMQINKDVRGSQGDRWLADHPYMEKEKQEEFEKLLRKIYDSEKPNADSLYRLANFSDKEGAAWLADDLHGYSPEQKAKSVEAAKFIPLLYGAAQPGEDWYSRGVLDLKNKAVEEKLGYDVSTKEGFKEFLDKLSEYQQEYDRAQNLKEFQDQMGLAYWPTKLAYPSMMTEGENAIMTGEGGDAETLSNLGALDALTNVGIVAAPSMKLMNGPVRNGIANAILQGFIEGERQGATEVLSKTGQEADVMPVIGASTMGATRPMAVGAAAQYVSKIPNREATSFARGITRSQKAGNPVVMERGDIENLFKNFNSKYDAYKTAEKEAQQVEKAAPIIDKILKAQGDEEAMQQLTKLAKAREQGKHVPTTMETPAEWVSSSDDLYKAKQILDLFGMKDDVPIDIPTVMANYDKPVRIHRIVSTGKKEAVPFEGYGAAPWVGAGDARVLTQKNLQTYQNLFPEKWAAEAERNKWMDMGLKTGEVLGDLGGRFEPAFKLGGSTLRDIGSEKKTKEYERQPWYKDLKKNNPEAAKIIEEAFKKKEEE